MPGQVTPARIARVTTTLVASTVVGYLAFVALAGQRETTIGALHLPDDKESDRWERAAMLIHSRYIAGGVDTTPAARPWAELDEFYKDSNRLLVKHMLRIVEVIAEHTWNGPVPEPVAIPHDAEPLEQLELMGFDRDASTRMARAEHERWREYYEKHHWRYGVRDDGRKHHPSLQDWAAIQADPVLYRRALATVSVTLLSLRELGYRSRPVWERFERAGTVVAQRRTQPWTWTTETGALMTAAAGDWEVRDGEGGDSWSVRADIFGASYRPCEDAPVGRYQRTGTVLARRARPGERIDTLEGPASAATGYWVVKGEQGETWPVPADQFARRYRRAENPSTATVHNTG